MSIYCITACFQYNTDSGVDVTAVNSNCENVYEDNIFGRQDILYFFSGVFKGFKYVKYPKGR